MNKKLGFTVSELLISIAIIAIVSAMGMTIAKRGTDDAYKNYFAVGTMNLNNALAQIETGDVNVGPDVAGQRLVERTEFVTEFDNAGNIVAKKDDQGNALRRKMAANPDADIFLLDENGDPLNDDSYPHYEDVNNPTTSSTQGNDFRGPMWITNNLKYLFGDTNIKGNNTCDPSSNIVQDHCVINAGNGITYEIANIAQNRNEIRMMMIVPAPRTRQNPSGRARTEFLYQRNIANPNLGNNCLLIPQDQADPSLDARADLQDVQFISLQDRHDLLLAYIDDGVVGRHVPLVHNYVGSTTHRAKSTSQDRFAPITYGTFKDAYCTIIGDGNLLNCDDFNQIPVNVFNNFVVQPARDASGNIIRDGEGDNTFEFVDNGANNPISSGVIKFASPRKLK